MISSSIGKIILFKLIPELRFFFGSIRLNHGCALIWVILNLFLGFVTSIPELITFFEAQKHHKNSQNDMLGVIEATNNLLMSNVMNLFIIQSVGITIYSLFG